MKEAPAYEAKQERDQECVADLITGYYMVASPPMRPLGRK